jgi:small GTP-binding protein
MEFDDKLYKITIFDTGGQERFKTITENYYRGANAVFLVYDVTSAESFDNVRAWTQVLQRHDQEDKPIVRVLIGNKCDLSNRIITKEMGQDLANSLGCPFFETSAKTGLNVTEAFTTAIKMCVDRKLVGVPRRTQPLPAPEPPLGGWCSC